MAKIQLTDQEFEALIAEVLQRLAKDPSAAHLWHWNPRPGCVDEPPGPSRRNHLATLLGLLGSAALPAAAGSAGCDSETSSGDASVGPDAAKDSGPSPDKGACADDPCSCADDPCSCADDPCSCADDPCSCADDPCSTDSGPSPDKGACADDPCSCADDPCAGP